MRLSTTRNSIVITAFILFIFCVCAYFMVNNKTYIEIHEKTYEMILDEEFGVGVGE